MLRFDLRGSEDTLDPLARFKILVVMCEPNDRVRREEMFATLQLESGDGTPRRKPLSRKAFLDRVNRRSKSGVVAGGLLLTQLQLAPNGYVPSLNRAMPLVAGLLPGWDPETGAYWDAQLGHHPRSRKNMLRTSREFRSVAHLWAALLHGAENAQGDIWPGLPVSPEMFPRFLATAEAFLEMACHLPSPARGRRFAMEQAEAWTFTIPRRFVQHDELFAEPFAEEQLRVLNEQRTRNHLI
jgi:hypothetical protein